MEDLLTALRACAEPTRLRLLALAGRGAFCVMDLVAILGQSQPRLSRHLRLLHEAGLLDRVREGANVWLALPPADRPAGSLARGLLARLPDGDPVLLADRRAAARVLGERARVTTEAFLRAGAAWDEARALGLDADAIEAALLAALPAASGRLLDIGTGTGRLLELFAPHARMVVGIDASRAMISLARGRVAGLHLSPAGTSEAGTSEAGTSEAGTSEAGASQARGPEPGGSGARGAELVVRQGDMYRIEYPDGFFDAAVMHMLLHHAEDPAAAVAEAARVLAPGGRLLVADLAPHPGNDTTRHLAHRHDGFSDATLASLFAAAGLAAGEIVTIPGPLPARLWSAHAPSSTSAAAHAAAAPANQAGEKILETT